MPFPARASSRSTIRRRALLAGTVALALTGVGATCAAALSADNPTPTTSVTTTSVTTTPPPDTAPAPTPDRAPPVSKPKPPVHHVTTTSKPASAPKTTVVRHTAPVHPVYKPPVHTLPVYTPSQPTAPVVARSSHTSHATTAPPKRKRAAVHHVKAPAKKHKPAHPATSSRRPVRAPSPQPVRSASKRQLPSLPISLAAGTTNVATSSVRHLADLAVLALLSLAACFLAAAALPLYAVRNPRLMPVALRLRPTFGAVGFSLLAAGAVIYVLGAASGV